MLRISGLLAHLTASHLPGVPQPPVPPCYPFLCSAAMHWAQPLSTTQRDQKQPCSQVRAATAHHSSSKASYYASGIGLFPSFQSCVHAASQWEAQIVIQQMHCSLSCSWLGSVMPGQCAVWLKPAWHSKPGFEPACKPLGHIQRHVDGSIGADAD